MIQRADDSADVLDRELREARTRTLELVNDLEGDDLLVPCTDILNPPLWEIGHVAWFQEFWCLRRDPARPSSFRGADQLWNSITVSHDSRWRLELPGRAGTLAYMEAVLQRVLERLHSETLDRDGRYFYRLALFHEDMHAEALVMMRQELGHPLPAGRDARESEPLAAPGIEREVELPGGTFELGARRNEPFVFDNEKWAHERIVRPFRMARAPVTQTEFLEFVADQGYERRELWSAEGWKWRQEGEVVRPRSWKREGDRWMRRVFDRWVPLSGALPMIHVSWHEAQAYCRWKGCRLPTELEWEYAAATPGTLATWVDTRKRRYPWGETPPTLERAHLDFQGSDVAPVHAFPAGDSAHGLRQMVGNVWEWTSSPFTPYPGFEPDPYREYSQPWFDTHQVLRGGSFVTRGRMIRNTWRNFYLPGRRDVFAGFRTARDAE